MNRHAQKTLIVPSLLLLLSPLLYKLHKINFIFIFIFLGLFININNIYFVHSDCIPLSPRQGIDVVCTLPSTSPENSEESQVTDCYTSYVPEGTTAIFSCSKYYVALSTIEQAPNQLICRNSSKWSGLELFTKFTCELDCGKSSLQQDSDITTFIIKGNATNSENWPWHASIYKLSQQLLNDTRPAIHNNSNSTNQDFLPTSDSIRTVLTSNYQCGGTLIHAFHLGFVILTAAHCFLDEDYPFSPISSELFQVVLGGHSSNMDDNLMNPNAHIFSVEQMFIHESYTPIDDKHLHDIAILKLYEPVVLTQWIRPVCFSSNDKLVAKNLKTGSKGEVIGFGRRDEANVPSPTLVHATIPIVDNLECFEHLSRNLEEGQICAGYLSEKTSVCSGDSGGGLIFPTNSQGSTRYFIQGIVSYGYKTCEKYAVFTKVVHYMDWMRLGYETMFDHSDNFNQALDGEEATYVEASTISSISQPSCPTDINIEPSETDNHDNNDEPVENTRKLITSSKNENNCECSCIEVTISESEIKSQSHKNNNNDRNRISNNNTSTRPVFIPAIKLIHEAEYEDYHSIALTMHNHYRFRHGSPPLQLNNILNIEAKKYADKLIRENTFVNQNEPSSTNFPYPYNKNIFELKEFHKSYPSQPSQIVRQAIKHWYADISSYNWYSPSTSTFSQIVWKSTKEIGVGYSISTLPSNNNNNNNKNFRTVVVVTYSPPGNTIGIEYHRNNVFPRQN